MIPSVTNRGNGKALDTWATHCGARGLRFIYWGHPGGLELLSQTLPVLAPAPAKATTSARHRRRERREGLRRGRRGHQDVRTVSLSHLR